jgi:hypothetical protein
MMIGATAAAVGLVAAIGFKLKAKSEVDLAPALDEETTREIMKSLSQGLASSCIRFSNAAEKIKMQMQQQGQMLEDAQIMQHFIFPHFKTAMAELEQKVCDDYDIADFELEEAVNAYCDTDGEIMKCANDIRNLIVKFGGQVESDEVVRSSGAGASATASAGASGGVMGDVGLEDVLELFQDLTARVLEATEQYAAAHVQLHGPPTDPQGVQDFQTGMVQLHTDIQNACLEEYNLTEQQFQDILMKHANAPEVQSAFMQMQYGIQQKLAMSGIGGA